jgi:hypothetical protein
MYQDCLRTEGAVIQTALVRIPEGFGNLAYQAEPHLNVQVRAAVTQEKIQALRLGVVLKEQRRTTLMLMQVQHFENASVVDAFEQSELTFCRLPLHGATVF